MAFSLNTLREVRWALWGRVGSVIALAIFLMALSMSLGMVFERQKDTLDASKVYHWTIEEGGIVLVSINSDRNGRAIAEVIQNQLFKDSKLRMRQVEFGRARRSR